MTSTIEPVLAVPAAESSVVPAAVGMWSPNLVMFVIALYLTLYTVRERAPIPMIRFPSRRKKDDS